MKTLKIMFLCAVVGIAAPVFAEGGSDRLIERIDSRHASTVSN
ncbi:co-regulatory protein PtrA N-terminal domain-containing protein [Pseudomonas sp. BN417]|nr:co-regulatory protein PtrA N-terminal domain-containing protein [Pseudomonas sp. BN417]